MEEQCRIYNIYFHKLKKNKKDKLYEINHNYMQDIIKKMMLIF